jgi:hypothetical protein
VEAEDGDRLVSQGVPPVLDFVTPTCTEDRVLTPIFIGSVDVAGSNVIFILMDMATPPATSLTMVYVPGAS